VLESGRGPGSVVTLKDRRQSALQFFDRLVDWVKALVGIG
jgi:hypothetical protein